MTADRGLGQERIAVENSPGAIVVDGDNRGALTTFTFIGAHERLSDAFIDPAGLYGEAGLVDFCGRAWIMTEIDGFVGGNDRGFVVIEANAGWGKTALLATVAARRGYPQHFARLPGARSARAAQKNLAAQLIEAWRLEEFAPGGVLPNAANEPGWLPRVLAAAARRRDEVDPNHRIVLVVDDVDQFAAEPDQLPLDLPALLPTGVYVVMSCRTGSFLPVSLRQPYLVRTLATGEANNLADMRRYVTLMAAQPDVAALLEREAVDPAWFVEALTSTCAGVWIYLRYLLEEIRRAMRSPAQILNLPGNVWNYYAEYVSRLRERSDWGANVLPLLATLGAAGEPLRLDTLCRLAGVDRDRGVRFVQDSMRPFLEVSGTSPGVAKYAIYHQSLREFLAVDEVTEASSAGAALAEELGGASRRAHARIGDYFLTLWGGLSDQLPVLANRLALAGAEDGYALRHLFRHLEFADRAEDMHAVLACETRGSEVRGDQSVTNVWHLAHDSINEMGTFLDDVASARRVAEGESNRSVRDGRPAPSIAREVRYALINSSLTFEVTHYEFTDDDIVTLVGALVDGQAWSLGRAMLELQHSRRPSLEALGWSRLARHFASDECVVRFQAALDRAESDWVRDVVIRSFAAHLPTELTDLALEEAYGLSDRTARCRALASLVPHRPHLVSEVLHLCSSLSTEDCSGVLASIAPALSADLVPEALRIADAIDWPSHRAVALAPLLSLLSDHQQRDEEFSRLLTDVEQESNPRTRRTRTLAALVGERRLPGGARVDLWSSDERRTDILSAVGAHLPGRLLARAVQAALGIGTDWYRARALAALVWRLGPGPERTDLLHQLVTDARRKHRDRQRLQYSSQIMNDLTNNRLLMNLVERTDRVPPDPADGWAVVTLAPIIDLLPDGEDRAFIEAAHQGAARSMDLATWRPRDLVRLAPRMPPATLIPIIRLAREIGDWDSVFVAYNILATRQGADDEDYAKSLADNVKIICQDAIQREYARPLVDIAPYLPLKLLIMVTISAAMIRDRESRIHAFLGIAEAYPGVKIRRRMLRKAARLARWSGLTSEYVKALGLLSRSADTPAERAALIEKALRAVWRNGSVMIWNSADSGIDTRPADGENDPRATETQSGKDLTPFIALIPFLAPEQLRNVAATIRDLPDADLYGDVLAEIDSAIKGSAQQAPSLASWVEIRAEMTDVASRRSLVSTVIRRVPDIERIGGVEAVRNSALALRDAYLWWQ